MLLETGKQIISESLCQKRTFIGVFRKAWGQSTTVDAAVKGFQWDVFLDPSIVGKFVKTEASTLYEQEGPKNEYATVTETGQYRQDC